MKLIDGKKQANDINIKQQLRVSILNIDRIIFITTGTTTERKTKSPDHNFPTE